MCNDTRKNRDLRANVDVLESCEQADIEMKLTSWKLSTVVNKDRKSWVAKLGFPIFQNIIFIICGHMHLIS